MWSANPPGAAHRAAVRSKARLGQDRQHRARKSTRSTGCRWPRPGRPRGTCHSQNEAAPHPLAAASHDHRRFASRIDSTATPNRISPRPNAASRQDHRRAIAADTRDASRRSAPRTRRCAVSRARRKSHAMSPAEPPRKAGQPSHGRAGCGAASRRAPRAWAASTPTAQSTCATVSALRPATSRPRSPSPARNQPRAPGQPGRLRPFGLAPLPGHRQVAQVPAGAISRQDPAIRAKQTTLAASGVHAARHRLASRLSSADPSAGLAASRRVVLIGSPGREPGGITASQREFSVANGKIVTCGGRCLERLAPHQWVGMGEHDKGGV